MEIAITNTIALEYRAAEVCHEDLNHCNSAEHRQEASVLAEVVEQVSAVGSCVKRIEYCDKDKECKICGVQISVGFTLNVRIAEQSPIHK